MSEITCTYCHNVIEGVELLENSPDVVILYAHTTCQAEHEKTCPTCSGPLKAPFFAVLRLEGYVCDRCRIYYNTDLQSIAFLP